MSPEACEEQTIVYTVQESEYDCRINYHKTYIFKK